jgi:hypothetical protein
MRLFATAEERRVIQAQKRLIRAQTREEIISCFVDLGGKEELLRALQEKSDAEVFRFRAETLNLMRGLSAAQLIQTFRK